MSDKEALQLALFLIMNAGTINWRREKTIIHHNGKNYKLLDITDKLIEMIEEVMNNETEQ